jgi:nucleoside triphosphate pyrophosphatase
VPDVEELTVGDPAEVVVENARRKARAGMEMAGRQPPKLGGAVTDVEMAARERALVLGVDTEVVLDGRLLGKAEDERQARERLTALSGRTHEVLSGVVLISVPKASTLDFVGHSSTKSSVGSEPPPSVPDAGASERSGVASTQVTFRDLPPGAIEAYLASGEWRDRAGAYAVQGLGASFVERVDGDLSNVIGLPVNRLLELAPELIDAAGDPHC